MNLRSNPANHKFFTLECTTEQIAKFVSNRNLVFIVLLSILLPFSIRAQEQMDMYYKEPMLFHSDSLGLDMDLELMLPYELPMAKKDFRIPLILLFDKQNSSTYKYNTKTIDYLSGVGGQMPGCIVVGIPFEGHPFRFGATRLSDERISMQHFADFLFKELIPELEKRFPAISSRIIIGHSRTGYLVNYLTAHNYMEIDAAVACSGFLEDDSTEEFFRSLPLEQISSKEFPLKYYMSSGDTYVEQSYKKDNALIDSLLSAQSESNNSLLWQHKINPNANHFTNYVETVPWALCDLFKDYNAILQARFESDFLTHDGRSAIEEYAKDLSHLEVPIDPSMTHINSIASHYYNKEDYKTCLEFLNLGITTYPSEPSLILFRADTYQMMGNNEACDADLKSYDELIKLDIFKQPGYLDELKEWRESME